MDKGSFVKINKNTYSLQLLYDDNLNKLLPNTTVIYIKDKTTGDFIELGDPTKLEKYYIGNRIPDATFFGSQYEPDFYYYMPKSKSINYLPRVEMYRHVYINKERSRSKSRERSVKKSPSSPLLPPRPPSPSYRKGGSKRKKQKPTRKRKTKRHQ